MGTMAVAAFISTQHSRRSPRAGRGRTARDPAYELSARREPAADKNGARR